MSQVEWKEYNLYDICEVFDKKRIPLSSQEREGRKGDYRYYGAQGVIDYVNDYIFDGEYILLAEDGDNLKSRKQSLVQKVSGKFWVNNHAHILSGNGVCATDFLYYLLSGFDFAPYITGSAQPKLSQQSLAKIFVKIPPLAEQKRIAGILSSLDDKIELNNKINKNLEEQIDSIIYEMVLLNESCQRVKLGDYLYIKGRIGWKGLKKDEYLDSSGYRIINGESLMDSGVDWTKAGYISKERYDESPEIMLEVGDILLSKDGTIGKIGYIDSLELPTSVASGIFVIRNQQPENISTAFIYYLLKSRLFKGFIEQRTEGSVIPHLYQKDFMDFIIPLPISQEMKKINDVIQPMFEKVIANLNENKNLIRQRESLLLRLMFNNDDLKKKFKEVYCGLK